MTKVQIAAPTKERDSVLQFLQEEEIIHLAHLLPDGEHQTSPSASHQESDTAYELARVQFALEFIARLREELQEKTKWDWKNLFSSKPAAYLNQLEEAMRSFDLHKALVAAQVSNDALVEIQAHTQSAEEEIRYLEPWENLELHGRDKRIDVPVIHTLITFSTRNDKEVYERLSGITTAMWQEVHREANRKTVWIYGEVVVHRDDEEALRSFIEETEATQITLTLQDDESVSERIKRLQKEIAKGEKQYQDIIKRARPLLQYERKLKFTYDALLHKQEREIAEQQMAASQRAIVLAGWIPTDLLAKFRFRLEKQFPSAALEKVSSAPDETPPVALHNKKIFQPFEAVTNIYGKPAYHELDPSAALSIFFLVSFGLALTDAGYGIIMATAMWAAERFFRLKREMRKMVRLLFYTGLFTIVLGALTGGWFGFAVEEMREGIFRDALLAMKVIDPISSPLTLLGIVLLMGIVQLLFAWVVRAWHHWQTGQKQNIWLDDIPWITMVIFLLVWAGAKQEMFTDAFIAPFGWLVIANTGYLVVTQGRTYKNPLLKLGGGVLSLYGLVSFVSDTLSYSRLLALGLATGIIGLVVNLIASMVYGAVPVAGFLLAVIVFVGGHAFNLGINTLGAFIHSGRLQFVEFFPKFMEGGGVPYKPLGRVSKYVDNPNEFI